MVANPIENIQVFINSPDSTISLTGIFSDEDDDDNLITVSVSANSNPGLVSTAIVGSDLTFSFTPDGFGSSVISLQHAVPIAQSNPATETDGPAIVDPVKRQ